MKIVIFSDIHHGITIGKLGASGFDLRMEDTFKIEEKITDFCVVNEIDTLVYGGDRYKSRNPSVWLMNQVDALWDKRRRLGIKTISLIGNHDVYRVVHYGSSYSALWQNLPGLTICSTPAITEIGGRQIGFLPYGYPLSDIDGKVDVLFFHDEIRGFEDDRGYKAPAWFGSRGLDLKELEQKCKIMIGGHIHSHIGIAGKGVYVGAPYQIDRLDIGKHRGLIVLDLDTLEIEFVEIGAPQLIELTVVDASGITKEAVRGNYVTCFVKSGTERDVEKVLQDYEAKNFVVHTIKERGFMVEQIAKEVYASENPESAIMEYVSSRELANKDFVTEIGLRLWKKVGEK